MNVPHVASSIKFFADSSSKKRIHYLDHCIVRTTIKGIQSLCLCWFKKIHLECAFLDFQYWFNFSFLSENVALCFKAQSAVKSYGVLLYGFSIRNNFRNIIHTVHTLFMHEAHPCSLQVYLVLHCVHFLWLFLWWASPVIQ